MSFRRALFIFLPLLQTCASLDRKVIDFKSSLTLVLDKTVGMKYEIYSLNNFVDKIFDVVDYSSQTFIKNVILLTYNDSSVNFPLIASEREELRTYLSQITEELSEDECSAGALNGIKYGLESSPQNSLLYVVTDGSAKDFNMYEEVRNIARKKQIPVTFLSTYSCKDSGDPEFQVFYKLAKDTYGEVYKIYQEDLFDMLTYIINIIKSRRTQLAYKTFPKGNGNKFDVSVDSETEDVTVSVTGLRPTVHITDEDGTEVDTETLINLKEIKIVKILGNKPSSYKIDVGSRSETYVKVTGKTSVHIQCGFSSHLPSSLVETTSRPTSNEEMYLSIQLYGDDVNLTYARVLDLDGNLLANLSLESVDGNSNFYTSRFRPPTQTFRIVVHGFDLKTKTEILRETATPIEAKDRQIENAIDVGPIVTVEGWPKLSLKFKNTTLKCKIYGYPITDSFWQNVNTTETHDVNLETLEEPYLYLSKWDIGIPKANYTYKCAAVGPLGLEEVFIEVEVGQPPKNIKPSEDKEPPEIYRSKLIHIAVSGEDVILKCHVIKGIPKPVISWSYVKAGGLHFQNIKGSNKDLNLKSVSSDDAGIYRCNASNSIGNAYYAVQLIVENSPKIIGFKDHIEVREGESLNVFCNTSDISKTTVSWLYESNTIDAENIKIHNHVLSFRPITSNDSGTYTCKATNNHGSDERNVFIEVLIPVHITIPSKTNIELMTNQNYFLKCNTSGTPKPENEWFFTDFSGKLKPKPLRFDKVSNGYHLQNVQPKDEGYYTCIAKNKYESRMLTYSITVGADIKSLNKTVNLMINQSYFLECNTTGIPKPDIEWSYNDFNGDLKWQRLRHDPISNGYYLVRVQPDDEGYYICNATNKYASKNITYVITVTAPPTMRDNYLDRHFEMVNGDVGLTINCSATAHPPPKIIWKHDNKIINGSDSATYDINNGNLKIKSISRSSQGKYTCLATNELNTSALTYIVTVNEYPLTDVVNYEITYTEGTSSNMECKTQLKENDEIRWYKDKQGPFRRGNIYYFNKISKRDEGIYTCRVSNEKYSYSINTRVRVLARMMVT